MESMHGALTHAYRAFLIASGHKEAGSWDPRMQTMGNALEDDPARAHPLGESATDADVASDVGQGEMQPDLEPAATTAGLADVDWAALDAKARRGGYAFIEDLPLGKLMLLRRCAEPFRVAMAEYLRLSSLAREVTQQAAEVTSMAMGADGVGREFRIVVAALHTLEDRFLSEVRKLLEDYSLWACLPLERRAVRFGALVFRMLSRMGCSTKELIYKPHVRFPCRRFLLLEDPDIADVIASAQPCELGPLRGMAAEVSAIQNRWLAWRLSLGL